MRRTIRDHLHHRVKRLGVPPLKSFKDYEGDLSSRKVSYLLEGNSYVSVSCEYL